MTITLAAVYAPIGFQGGLTGALFREFAFTLAGAVFISGVVALTLSPMMSSRLLQRRAQARAGSRARIDRGFERLEARLRAHARRRRCARAARRLRGVDRPLAADRPDVHVLARASSRRTRTRASSSARIDVPANATLEQLTPYTDAGLAASSRAMPEFDHSFQLTFPTGGFGGMLVKPWDERKRSIFPIQEELRRKLGARRGRPRAGVPAAGAAERGPLPGRVRDRVDREPRGAARASPSSSCRTAIKSGQFAFPPIIDVQHRSGEEPRSSSIATRSPRWA